nr:hypothetical protein [Tanacetum cinerariifolium]
MDFRLWSLGNNFFIRLNGISTRNMMWQKGVDRVNVKSTYCTKRWS